MRFINIEFVGGLGNQLFQYATVKALMKKNDSLFFDINNYKNEFYNRGFNLNKYLVNGKNLNESYFERFFNPYSKVNKLIKKLNLFTRIDETGFYIHSNLQSQLRLFTSIRGYWQSHKYFNSIREQLKTEIVPKNIPSLPSYMQANETVAIHIRRTDYLDDSRFNFLGIEYYTRAIRQINTRLKNPQFIFFSDDLQWCRENFNICSSFFCEDKNWQPDYLQLYLMSRCNHHIIANSSFSWWSAWLSNNPNQVVIRPARPFKDASLFYENYYPENWIIVEN